MALFEGMEVISIPFEKCRVSTTLLGSAAFIPPKGCCIRGYQPGKYMLKDVPIAQKNPA